MSFNKIDIFGISESKLNESHPTEHFALNGFQLPFRKDRTENRGGGLLIYVKDTINCSRREDLESHDLEHIWLEIKQSHAKPFLLCIIYRQPDARSAWKDSFEINIENVQLEDKEILLLGDFNRDLVNARVNREWVNFTSSLGFTQLITNPTRECNNSQTLIDHIYSDNPQNIMWTSVPNLGLSDHFPIFCSRKTKCKSLVNTSIN